MASDTGTDAKARWEHTVAHPFVPASASQGGNEGVRIANALEYIAAQLGRISAALEKIDQRSENEQVRLTREQVSADTDRTKAMFGHPPE
jgi:hypothetical protein